MRRGVFTMIVALALLPSSPARAQRGDEWEGRHRARPAAADTSRFLPRWLSGFVQLGPGWMQSPTVVRKRYGASIEVALGLEARPGRALAFDAKVDYLNLSPLDQSVYGLYDSSGVAPGYVLTGGGTGHRLDLLLTARVHAFGPFWVQGGGGGGHFSSGYPNAQFVDVVRNTVVDVPGKSGFGGAMTGGLEAEFHPNQRDHMFAAANWLGLERGGTRLDFFDLVLGYRIR